MARFKPRERKHKKRARIEKARASDVEPTAPVMSGKKRKRLNKYIDNKLRKEEKASLLEKLAKSGIDTSLLQSSKHLGKRAVSKRDALSRALKHQRAGIESENDRHLLFESVPESEAVVNNLETAAIEPAIAPAAKPMSTTASAKRNTGASFGGGLRDPLPLDGNGAPTIKKRKRSAKVDVVPVQAYPPSWYGFSSESDTDKDEEESGGSHDSHDDEDESEDEDGWSNAYPLFAIPKPPPPPKEAIPVQPKAPSDFKTWAREQLDQALNFTPTPTFTDQAPKMKLDKLRPREEDPLPPELQTPSSILPRQVHSVAVHRSDHIQESRSQLPIFAVEQKIMEAIHNNPIVIVSGATGSGKTTQVPQFLYESGYGDSNGPTPGLIGVTQPRRVAANILSKRVGQELMDPFKCAYVVRYDGTMGPQTVIKFMTDGILLREISRDFLLSKYSVIVIDEVHERNVNTDILLGMLSRITGLREKLSKKYSDTRPLKLVIMSATIMADTLLNNPRLFPDGMPPLVESEGRQHSITLHFSRRTPRDYVEEAFRKVVKGHRKLPPGAILVFLTGHNEITHLLKKLRTALSNDSSVNDDTRIRITSRDAPLESDDMDLVEALAEHQSISEDSSEDEDEEAEFDIREEGTSNLRAMILPFYSQLPREEQLLIFRPLPENTRLIIVATNVAETSVTIPSVRYVFDCGKVKQLKYDPVTGVQKMEIGWISKASAIQRAGRAGRTSPGHCWRLYSSAVYERDFTESTVPEILRTPVERVVLQLKSMDIQHMTTFPFPTPPKLDSLVKAEKLLTHLQALDENGRVTNLGRDLSMYPISPRLARILSLGNQHDSIYHVAAMVAAMSVVEMFIPYAWIDPSDQTENKEGNTPLQAYRKAHKLFGARDDYSDAVKHAVALCTYMDVLGRSVLCEERFLQPNGMEEAFNIYQHLLRIIKNTGTVVDVSKHKLDVPDKFQIAVLKQAVTVAYIDQIAIRADLAPTPFYADKRSSKVSDVPYLTLFRIDPTAPTDAVQQLVFVHPSSVLADTQTRSTMPQYLVYSHIQLSTTSMIRDTTIPKNWMFPLTDTKGSFLASFARGTPLLEYGKPIGRTEAISGNERYAWVVPNLVGERGGNVWPLMSAVKTRQERDARGVWKVKTVLS